MNFGNQGWWKFFGELRQFPFARNRSLGNALDDLGERTMNFRDLILLVTTSGQQSCLTGTMVGAIFWRVSRNDAIPSANLLLFKLNALVNHDFAGCWYLNFRKHTRVSCLYNLSYGCIIYGRYLYLYMYLTHFYGDQMTSSPSFCGEKYQFEFG